MRLSIREDDPGYNLAATNHCTVFVNGLDVTARCHTADEEEGKAWCFKHNEEERKFMDPATGEPATEVLVGDVVILLDAKVNGYDPHTSH